MHAVRDEPAFELHKIRAESSQRCKFRPARHIPENVGIVQRRECRGSLS